MTRMRTTEGSRGRHAISRQIYFLPVVFMLVLGGCSSEENWTPDALTGCVWWGQVAQKGIYEEMAIEFAPSEGGLQGVIHFLSGGKKVSELPIRDIRIDPPRLRFSAGVFTIESTVDIESGRLAGKAVAKGGHGMDFSAERRDPATVPGLLPGCADYRYRLPEEMADGWKTAPPEDVGLERTSLEGIVNAIAGGEGGVIHSLIIVQNDRLVLEEYFHGYGAEDLHAIASCTKSVTSLLIGIALDRGLVAGIDVPVLDSFPAYAKDAASGWTSVRLVHLLTMTAGLGWPENSLMPGRGADPGFSGNGPDGFRRIFSREVTHEPGTRWNYANPDVNLLGEIIYKASGLHTDAFAKQHLFSPLGITDFDWSTYGKADGYPNLAGSLRLRPRDMAKIGALVLAEGRWQDRRLVSSKWIQTSCSPKAETGDDSYEYGYLWWLMNLPDGKRIIEARGWGSQFVFIDAAHRRVIAVTGGNDTNGKTFAIVDILAQHLYPEVWKVRADF